MFSYLKEKTIGMASTVGNTVVGGGQAAVNTVFAGTNQQNNSINSEYKAQANNN